VPIDACGAVCAVGHELDGSQLRSLEMANLRERVSFHVDHVAVDQRFAGLEAIAGAANALRQLGKERRKLELRRDVFERRRTQRKAEARHIHVALHEAPARDEAAPREGAAARRAEVQDDGSSALCPLLGELAREPMRGVDLADTRVEHVDAALAKEALSLDFERHHDDHRVFVHGTAER